MQTLAPTTWEAAANETVREMIQRNGTPQSLEELRTYYDYLAERIQLEPDLEPAITAAMWGTFGARVQAAAPLLSGESLLWTTVIDTVVSKQRDYGKENILKFGQIGLVVRTHDKLARLEHLRSTGATPRHESVRDTVLDLVGYSVLAVMLARGWFGLPL